MDKIILEDIEVFAHHGVFDAEKRDGQNFYISLTMFVDKLTENDSLENTVDYGKVALSVSDYVKNNVFDLIESVAYGIANLVLREFSLVREVSVTVKKPSAPIPLKFGNVMVEVHKKWHTAYIALGSNLGDSKGYLDMAVEGFQKSDDSRVLKVSSYITTKPYGVLDQPDFLNAVMKIETLLSPHDLLDVCQELEKDANRDRLRHWGERTLDVDILLYDDEIIHTDRLIVPHLELHMRDFVLKPLVEIDAGVVHPVLKKTAYSLLKELDS